MSADPSLGQPLAGLELLRTLPDWLCSPLQPEQVISALTLHVPELRSGALRVCGCKTKRLFLQDTSGAWDGTYQLRICSAADEAGQLFNLHGWLRTPPEAGRAAESTGAFGQPGWHCYLPELNLALEVEPPESELIALDEMTSPEQARALIENVLQRAEEDPALRVADCRIKVLSYKPGSRCTIRYEIETAGREEPLIVIGKIYRKASKAQNAYDGMFALYQSPLAASSAVTIARPLAFLADQKAMFQTAIPGETTLEDLLVEALAGPSPQALSRLEALTRKTAAGLAAFHRLGAPHGKTVTLEDRVVILYELLDRLAVPFPTLRQAVLPAVQRIEGLIHAAPADPPVPTHGTFNPEQVLIQGDQIGFIDFDDYCTAEPGFDVGLFRGAVKDTGLKDINPTDFAAPGVKVREERLALLDRINDAFLDEYTAHYPVSRRRVYLWEAVDYLRSALQMWIKVKPAEADHALFALEHHLEKLDLA